MPIHYSVLISLVFTAVLSTIFWEMPVQSLKAAVDYGALKGLWLIVIVIFGAIFSYNVIQAARALDILRDILASISEDKRIQVLLISWCFGGFLETAAGYGTAVAIPIGVLIALGFNPLKAAIASLVTDTIPTAFGTVRIPVSILAEQVNLPVYTLDGTTILQLALFNIPLPFVIVCIIGGDLKTTRGVFLIMLICGIITLAPRYFVVIYFGAELSALTGSLVSLSTMTMVSRLRKGKTDPEWCIEVSRTRETTSCSAEVLLRVDSIYLFIFVLILLCPPLFPTIKGAAFQLASVLHFTLADGKTAALKVGWVTTSGVLTIFAAITGGFIQGVSAREMLGVFIKTVFQLKNSIVTIMATIVLATVMDLNGIISTLAQSIVDLTDDSYVSLTPVTGTLGTFTIGSDTNSNILFSELQAIVVSKLHIDPNWLAAANASGATGEKMISPQSVAITVPVTGMDGQANQIISGTMKYCYAYIMILGLKVGLFYYRFMT